jgi:large subunit ribosomal protein L7/L12
MVGRMTAPQDLIETFKTMTLGELTEFRRRFEAEFEVSADLPAPVPAPPPGVDEPEPEPEPQPRKVRLVAAGPNRIRVIKQVRVLTGIGLAEAKALVDAAPTDLLIDLDPDKAQAAAATLTEEGATIELVAV